MNKIRKRFENLSEGLNMEYVSLDILVSKLASGIYQGVTTDDLDHLAAETCAYMTIVHPDYSKLASRIAISNLHKRTSNSFHEVSTRLYTKIKDKVGRPAPMLADDVYEVIDKF